MDESRRFTLPGTTHVQSLATVSISSARSLVFVAATDRVSWYDYCLHGPPMAEGAELPSKCFGEAYFRAEVRGIAALTADDGVSFLAVAYTMSAPSAHEDVFPSAASGDATPSFLEIFCVLPDEQTLLRPECKIKLSCTPIMVSAQSISGSAAFVLSGTSARELFCYPRDTESPFEEAPLITFLPVRPAHLTSRSPRHAPRPTPRMRHAPTHAM